MLSPRSCFIVYPDEILSSTIERDIERRLTTADEMTIYNLIDAELFHDKEMDVKIKRLPSVGRRHLSRFELTEYGQHRAQVIE